MAKRL
ncbi:hypothetical protein YPPY98_3191, partial [Yersinia pestis PY-98]